MMVGNILIAKILTPTELGSFSFYLLIVNYVILIQIGIPNGLSRQFPYYMGKNDKESANKIVATAKLFSLVTSISIFIITVIISIFALFSNQYFQAMGYFVVGLSVIQTLYVTKFLKLLYRSNLDFNKLSKIEIIVASINFISIFFIYEFGLWGMGIRVLIVFLVDFYFSQKWAPVKIPIKWEKEIFTELMKIGAPIFFVSSIFALWPIVQRTMIFESQGEEALGLFSLAVAVQAGMSIITSSSSSIIFPKITAMLGEGKKFKELFLFSIKIDAFVFVFNLVIAIIGYFLIPFLVKRYLPEYVGVILTCQIFLVFGVISSITTFSNLYQLLGKNNVRLISFILGISAWFFFLILFRSNSFNLEIFPIAMILGQTIMYLFDIIYFKFFLSNSIEKNNFI